MRRRLPSPRPTGEGRQLRDFVSAPPSCSSFGLGFIFAGPRLRAVIALCRALCRATSWGGGALVQLAVTGRSGGAALSARTQRRRRACTSSRRFIVKPKLEYVSLRESGDYITLEYVTIGARDQPTSHRRGCHTSVMLLTQHSTCRNSSEGWRYIKFDVSRCIDTSSP